MKRTFLFLVVLLTTLASCTQKREGKPRLLVFSKHAGFYHNSIPEGIEAIRKLGAENGFETDTTQDARLFTEENLSRYAAVVFLNTTGNVLDYRQEAAFERYIQAGGGFVGVHSATDTEYDWGWYGRLVGAWFAGHPEQQQVRFVVKDKTFPATSFLPDSIWSRWDELYNFRNIQEDLKVVLTIDETSYHGGTNGAFHPMAWYHDFDGGRAFYTALGHTKESYSEPLFLQHLLGGIKYAMGENLKPDYSRAHTAFPPETDRFTKTPLAVGGEFYEPTEMTILPNLDVLIIQRRGHFLLYKNDTKNVRQVGMLKVYYQSKKSGANVEEGLLGLAKDPKFDKNHWIYVFYSPADSSVNRLSRFTFEKDTLDLSTEKVILEVKSDREICCHTGGSIAFGPDGLLYVSTGDNSTPFDERGEKYVNSGYGPLNDEPGHQPYDARRSSGNTNDLRGKILRIRPYDDGTYEIPEGNLFPPGTDKTRPEIYVMGNRNPYRISVDQKNGNLYWGEVGPDAAVDSFATRGPRGYDELNQARKAGFFGWPMFVGNNYPYHKYNYKIGESGPLYDPARPVNESRNNTGLTELPPVSPAFIWYPYAKSGEFPQLGSGGRNAMAGPVYYTDMFPKETRLPDYYNGKLIIYDWVRGWIKAVTMKPNGDYDKMEPFIDSLRVNALIDMEVGPDGKLYFLEYGNGWFTKNPDAGLFRIDYNDGNRPPRIRELKLDQTSGTLPFTIQASVRVTDPEKDKVHYRWNFGNGETKETDEPTVSYTYAKTGDYEITVTAVDNHDAESTSKPVAVYAGNTEPKVTVTFTSGNESFYLPGTPVQYKVEVKDDAGDIDPSRLFVSTDYVDGYGYEWVSTGHQQTVSGRALMLSLDCKTCHKETEKSIGPSFKEVALRYRSQGDAKPYLTEKILRGGSGAWGATAMAAHPDLSSQDALRIVNWIMTLAGAKEVRASLPAMGAIIPDGKKPSAALVLAATYTDAGGHGIRPLTGSGTAVLPGNRYSFKGKEPLMNFGWSELSGVERMTFGKDAGSVRLSGIDLTDVGKVDLLVNVAETPASAIAFELRLGSAEGTLLGQGSLKLKAGQRQGTLSIPVSATKGRQEVFLVHPKGDEVKGGMVTAVEFYSR